jgi:uncharacterized membrane protein YccC
MRRSEAWTMLRHLAPEWAESHPRPDLQARMRAAWRQRLIWHAERIAVLALLFWAIGLGIGLISA